MFSIKNGKAVKK